MIDTWRASDLEASLPDGAAVQHWVSQLGRDLTASNPDLRPLLRRNATPAGGPVVRFNRDQLKTASSPAAGLSSFSVALVFRADAVGSAGSQWYNNTGLVDAEQGGVTADWGLALDANARLGWGCGQPDHTLYLDSGSLVDSNYHVAVVTWGGGTKNVYLDNAKKASVSGIATGTRNNAGMAVGGMLTDVNLFFVGDIAEIRFYDTALSGVEATNLMLELMGDHLALAPVVETFSANTNQIVIDSAATLTWSVSNALSIRILPAPGAVATSGSAQVFPRSNTVYTLIATNAAGTRIRELPVFVDQLRPVASNQHVITVRNQATSIQLQGSDPQGSNLVFSIVTLPTHGTLSGSGANRFYTPVNNFVGNDQFTFRVNDGEFDSEPGIVTIEVQPTQTTPLDILLSTTNINPGTAPGSFIATLDAVDPDPQDTHTFALVSGFGQNSRFAISGNQLRAGETFVGSVGDTFSIRLRATDNTARSVEKNFVLAVTTNSQSVVINEVHYNPDDNTVLEEFIELHNPTSVPIDVTDWELSGAVDYILPPAVIPAGGFVVIAQDPSTIQARYGVSALGPWTGNLSSDGEEIVLENAGGKKVDSVNYAAEFPWPIAADGEGASMALVNPSLDNDLGSSWRSEMPPTPGATNTAFALNAAPNIRQVQHSPQSPRSTDSVTITAKVTDPDGVGSVVLEYQVVQPGNYIPSVIPVSTAMLIANPSLEPTPNPAYNDPANWISVAMNDSGVGGDTTANDSIYTVVLPSQAHRVLVRYRITVTDSAGVSRRAPFEDDPSLNFAFFVYDGVPAYAGFGPSVLETLPIYTLVSRQQDVIACTAYSGSDQIPQFQGSLAHPGRFAFNWPGTLVYDGEVYDHIRYRLHGANGRYQPGKRSWRFKMNDGRGFAARDQFGKKFPRKWTHITAGKGSNNRGVLTFSLNETVNYFLWNKVGVPAPNTIYFHYRVISTPQEQFTSYTGDFWGLNWAQEDYDAEFLDTHSLPKGNLYKLVNAAFSTNLAEDMVGQRRYQAPFAVTNGMDGALIQTALLGNQSSDWIRAHVNVDEWFRYHVVSEAIRHYDIWPDANKNAAWYFEPPYTSSNSYHGRFWFLPWDTDSTWGATWNSGIDLVYQGIFKAGSHPDLELEYRNTARHLRDLLFQPDQINPVIDAFAARLETFIPADIARWSNSPAATGSYLSLSPSFISPGLTGGLAGVVQDMKTFMFVGGTRPWWVDRETVQAGGWIQRLDQVQADSAIPNRPTLFYVGQPGYPMNSLTFECLPFSDPQGAGTFGAMEWRLAEVQNTNAAPADPRVVPPLEIDPVWESGRITTWTNRITIPANFVQTNRVYRARVRHADNTGRWSRWSEPVQFSVTGVDTLSELRQNLRFSEIMYHPPDFGAYVSDDLEYLELQNIGTKAIDLSGLTFTAGITFTFPNNTTLGAGQYFLLGRNAAALQARYPGVTVNGIYSGRLDNGGETLRLSTPIGDTVLEVTYSDDAPWPVTADGLGWSLVLLDPLTGLYVASSAIGGSPGGADAPSTIPPIVINEMLTHSDPPYVDFIELYNPTDSPANIGGWFMSDKPDVPKKYRIPTGTVIPAHGYLVYTQPIYDNQGLDFNLNSLGDEAYLFAADAGGNLLGYVHGVTFGAAENAVSFGRHVNSLGREEFVPLTTLSPGTNNGPLRIGPVVISEIMFQPPALGTNEQYNLEFIELQNIATTNVPMFIGTNGWRLDNGVTFLFPTNLTIPAGERRVVVSFNPGNNTQRNAFLTHYNLPSDTELLGPWSGRLNNDGEVIELQRPDTPESDGFVPYVIIDKVDYLPGPPWPDGARGTGLSLQRTVLVGYGNEPTHWMSDMASPGYLGEKQQEQDSDNDGMPDYWELLHAMDPWVQNGADDDDQDGVPNVEEWLAGTDPLDANSVLRLHASVTGVKQVALQFTAMADRRYRIQVTATLENPAWTDVSTIEPAGTNRTIVVTQSMDDAAFYRIVAP